MISIVQPLHVGNALRLFLRPPTGAVRWRILRNASGTFSGPDDPAALIAYEGDEHVIVDIASLQNEVLAHYAPFYLMADGSWVANPVATGTPSAIYEDQTTDVMSFVRERLEAGLQVEVQRGNLMHELGHIPVFIASPSLDRDLRMPLVTVHLEKEEPAERAIGEMLMDDVYGGVGGIEESEGYLASVHLTLIGWTLNGDERAELRKAIRRLFVANLPVFDSLGWLTPSLTQEDVDAVGGEYPAPMYQVMNTFTCTAPVRVSGKVDPITDVFARSN